MCVKLWQQSLLYHLQKPQTCTWQILYYSYLPVSFLLICVLVLFLLPISENGISKCKVLLAKSALQELHGKFCSSVFPLHHVYLVTGITRNWPSHWSLENAPGTNGRDVAMVQCIVAGWNFAKAMWLSGSAGLVALHL